MKLNVYSTATETACKLIQYINEILMQEPDKVYNIAFSGGLTPALMYDLWANDFVESTPWNRIHFWWVDERCVRPENSESNYGQMRSLLLNIAPIPHENIFRIKGENKPEYEAVRYTTLAKKLIPLRNGLPLFDIVLLGVGDDGHTSSIFPGQEHLLSSPDIYEDTYNPHTGQKRVALTGRTILNASKVIFLVTGKNKSSIIKEIFSGGDSYPASYIANHANSPEFFMDEYAASEI
ncbi:6-phosphogluconolactonase [Bacteroides sp. 519]|uniref:6-phosphogluconolactonase n=1 Tax=Bacteroides sp. 519 TaxID=2302937 RepID=UPI0013D6C1F6|nr:6-phosphogluconolactonase [Bacteroides sp. 519]NDV59657.1 6-phosphogluconolactonase [Bacteroides sp. 519]